MCVCNIKKYIQDVIVMLTTFIFSMIKNLASIMLGSFLFVLKALDKKLNELYNDLVLSFDYIFMLNLQTKKVLKKYQKP